MEEMRQETIEDLKKRNIWLCYDTVETERNKATAFYSAKSGAFLAKPEDFLNTVFLLMRQSVLQKNTDTKARL